MKEIEFIERNTLGDGWTLEVRQGLEVVGHIRGNRKSGPYRYFPGSSNILNPSFEEHSLEAIKKRVTQDPSGRSLGK